MIINRDVKHEGDRMQLEFEYIQKWLIGDKGIDVGCGTNRLSMEILAIDQQPDRRYSHCDLVHNCHDLEIKTPFAFSGKEFTFVDNELDYIFSSHCLEDFEDIHAVFKNWWKKIKPNGYMILLLPDMENGRYPKVGEFNGNPSHRTDVGEKYIKEMLYTLDLQFEIVQCDTIPHNVSCTIDIVIKKIK